MGSTSNHAKIAVICFVISFSLILSVCLINYKPMIKDATAEQLDAIHGIQITFSDGTVKYGTVAKRIVDYVELHPYAKVEDLRIIKGVDDMIIDQLKEVFR